MAISVDPATQGEYLVGTTLAARAQAIVSALTGTVTCKVYDGSDVERAAATFDPPWASALGGTITVGEVGKLIVSSGGIPDSNWYVKISNGTRWIRGTFGLPGDGRDFTWSSQSFETGQEAELGTITLNAATPDSVSAPANTSVPAINGTARVGNALFVTDGAWSGSPTPTYTYQWARGGADITGAVASTYTLVSADEGAMIGARVTATNSAGSASANAVTVGPVSPQVSTLAFATLPDPISLYQSGTFSLSSYVSGGVPPYTYSYTGTLPTGVSLNTSTGALSATASAALGTSESIQFHVDDSVTAASLPTFGITSAAGGSLLPFTFGHVFKQGDVPAGQFVNSDLTNWQAVPTTYWPDGSLRHAIIAGRATCSAAVLKPIALSVSATNRSGTALTEADLAAALPTTTLVAGGDSFTLNSIIGTAARHRTVCSGPVMSNWLYRRQIAGSNHLVAWFDVRLYIGGAVEIFPWMENAYLTVANPVSDTRNYTLTIGGVTKFSATNLPIYHHTRIPLISGAAFSYWTGTDPQIVPQHDVAYLRATKMVPNYGWTSPSATALNALQQTYTPNTLAGVDSQMGNAGTSPAILMKAQALYCTSGDARAYRAAIVSGLSGGSWSIHYRAEAGSTQAVSGYPNEPMRFSDYPSASLQVQDTPTIPEGTGTTNGTPVTTHQPSFGYFPWLISGRWFFLEEQLFWAEWNYLMHRKNGRRGESGYETAPYMFASGASGVIDPTSGAYTARGAAWSLRGLAQALAIVPTTHPSFASLKTAWECNTAFWRATFVDATFRSGEWANTLGLVGDYSSGGASLYGSPGGSNAWWGAGWQYAMIQHVLGFAEEMGLPQSATSSGDLSALVAHAVKFATGLAGDGSAGSWNWRRFGIYDFPIGTDGIGIPPETFYPNFGAALTEYETAKSLGSLPATAGLSLKAHSTNTDLATSASTIPWLGMQLAALSYAVNRGVVGASAGWSRVTGASNFNVMSNYFNDDPVYGIAPRSA